MSGGDIVLIAALMVYLLVFVPPAMRRIAFESEVVVGCSPDAAFALVSDPNNWPRYVPELQLRAVVRPPLKLGDLIYDRFAARDMTVEGIERVVAFEPGVRFGTQLVSGGHGTTGVYELFRTEGGTRIVFRCETSLTVLEAWAGNGFRRDFLASKLKANRDVTMQRIKGVLEADAAAASV
jgi:polyketide cyclase/dehydrase/lipid transport protein